MLNVKTRDFLIVIAKAVDAAAARSRVEARRLVIADRARTLREVRTTPGEAGLIGPPYSER